MLISLQQEETNLQAFRDSKLQHRVKILLLEELVRIVTISQTETHHNLLCKWRQIKIMFWLVGSEIQAVAQCSVWELEGLETVLTPGRLRNLGHRIKIWINLLSTIKEAKRLELQELVLDLTDLQTALHPHKNIKMDKILIRLMWIKTEFVDHQELQPTHQLVKMASSRTVQIRKET